jgi:cystathionine beta-lyase
MQTETVYDFETPVRRKASNLKYALTDPAVLRAGNQSFDGAEPDFKTAPAIERAVVALAQNGLYGFTLLDRDYQDAVCWWMKNSRGVEIHPEWIVPTLGVISAAATAIRLLTEEGEGIVVLSPVYNRFRQAATRLNRETTECPLRIENGRYEIDFSALEEALRPAKNKILVVCNPHNPIGRIWEADELERMAELAARHDVTIFSDEIFADSVYGGRTCPCFLDVPGAKAIVATSLGKSFHFTGVNHGNILISDGDLRARFLDRRTRDHFGSIDPLVYESVCAAYTPEGLNWLRAANAYVAENIGLIRGFFARRLLEVPVYGGEGAYLLWMDWRQKFGTEAELMDFLFHRAFFHLDPGSNYGAERFTRMCVASPRWCIEKALGTLEKALDREDL